MIHNYDLQHFKAITFKKGFAVSKILLMDLNITIQKTHFEFLVSYSNSQFIRYIFLSSLEASKFSPCLLPVK